MCAWDGSLTPIATTAYATAAELKAWIGITDAVDDTLLAAVLTDASRDIDAHLGRSFAQTVAGTVRYYTADSSYRMMIDDCVALTEVATDADGDRVYEATWTATDYDLLPENAATDSLPYTTLQIAPQGDYRFPVGLTKGVKLTGTWGWPAVPVEIKRACVLRAAWLFKRKDSPLGMAGNNDMGLVRVGRWDSDFEKLVETYRRITVT
jgi:hypothetical protein